MICPLLINTHLFPSLGHRNILFLLLSGPFYFIFRTFFFVVVPYYVYVFVLKNDLFRTKSHEYKNRKIYKPISQWESREKISTRKCRARKKKRIAFWKYPNTSIHCVAFACIQEGKKKIWMCIFLCLASNWNTNRVKAERRKKDVKNAQKTWMKERKETDFVTLNEIFHAGTNVRLVFCCCFCCPW